MRGHDFSSLRTSRLLTIDCPVSRCQSMVTARGRIRIFRNPFGVGGPRFAPTPNLSQRERRKMSDKSASGSECMAIKMARPALTTMSRGGWHAHPARDFTGDITGGTPVPLVSQTKQWSADGGQEYHRQHD